MDNLFNNLKKHKVLSEINVTPFVDIMLVLLIIFMITAPMMKQGIDINLPETDNTGVTVHEDPLILVVKKNKKIFINSTQIPISKLGTKIVSIVKQRKNKQVYIQADKFVEYGIVAQILATMRVHKIYQVSLVTTFKSRNKNRK